LREPLTSCSALTLCCFCLVSSPVTREQLTLDGLVFFAFPRSVAEASPCGKTSAPEARKSLVCTLYLVFKEPRTLRSFPTNAPSNYLDFAPALFGGTFQTYDDLPSLVNHFFRLRRKP
jgi:hypothetical protein